MNLRLKQVCAYVFLSWAVLTTSGPALLAAVSVPPAPAGHFNDYAGLLPPEETRSLDATLAQFERDTSNQLVVVIYQHLPGGASLEDYTVRTAQAWAVGRKNRDNGAVLFVFVDDRTLRIEVGYGLEGALTDATCHAIIENELKPRLRAGDPAGAMKAAVEAMMAAAKGEYTGTHRIVAETNRPRSQNDSSSIPFYFGCLFVLVFVMASVRRGHVYLNPSRRTAFDDFWDNNSGSGGSSGSWGGGSSGGGGFSGGGGSFGGGGASGKW